MEGRSRSLKRSEFVGQSREIEHLMRSVKAGRIVHAYLIAGGHGCGKRTLANILAQSLFCTAENKPCGECPACKRYESGTHPDARVLAPKGRSIGVEEIRLLIESLSNKSYEGGWRTVIVEQADKMTPSAQNALLKTLENPPNKTVFFLLSVSPSALLATVRSRCRMIRVAPLTKELCEQALVMRGLGAERASRVAGFSSGSVGRALEIDQDEGFFPLVERVMDSLLAIRGSASVADAVSRLPDEKERQSDVLDLLERIGRDRMAVENGANPDALNIEEIQRLHFAGSALLRGVLHTRQMLFSNVAWTSCVDQLFFSLAEG